MASITYQAECPSANAIFELHFEFCWCYSDFGDLRALFVELSRLLSEKNGGKYSLPCITVRCIFWEFSTSPYKRLDHRLVVSVVVEVGPAFDFAARYFAGSSFGLAPYKVVTKVVKKLFIPGLNLATACWGSAVRECSGWTGDSLEIAFVGNTAKNY